ncbi:MAG: hypothetical protein WDM96_17965 [Lacunisphaera sp.]
MTTPASRPPFDDTPSKLAAYLRLWGLAPVAAERAAAALLAAVPPPVAPNADTDEPALAGALARLDDWTATLVPAQPGESAAHRAVRGRARMFLAGLPAGWPDAFLTTEPPPALQAALAQAMPPLAPALQQTAMAPQTLDLGPVSKVADGTWRTFDKWPFLGSVAVWALFLTLVGAAFYLVHF